MPCSFRLRTTRPDGSRADVPLDDLLGESGLLGDNVYTEQSRVVEQVEVGTAPNTVTIDRMIQVVFVNTANQTLTLNFDNPPV